MITDGIGTRYQESWSGLLEPGKSEIIVLRSKPLYTQETKRTFFCAEAVTVNNGEVEKSILNNKVCNNIVLETVCQVFPIPVKDEIQIAVTASEEKLLKISIFNSKGTEIARDVLLK
ncbi:MAG: hypothetical protein EBV78_01520, partial [Candidatus Fonsibacter lacus]|nr:hypothetical protein [Candidatus Fonsibacter lacus]